MIKLRNYSKLGSFILINNDNFTIIEDKEKNKDRDGVGGISENGEVVGIYVKENKLYFFYEGTSYLASPGNLKCTNEYITASTRCFRVTIEGQEICNIIYKPFIDPGMVYYDADPEEFDVLLYLSNNTLKNEESLRNFIKGMKLVKERNNN